MWGLVRQQSDVLLALVVVSVVVMMVFPLSPFMLDTLLAVNICMSVMLLLLTIYVPSALSLSTFPSLLLFTTLFRLALNIAATKQILLHAHAGSIIETFGKLVVGGNIIVGVVVFLIITIVQFIVIAKGAERVAEVGARFTLDALPGKQMSIDADVRNGNVTAVEARRRRKLLEQEAQLHGGMDGAMKFVKGDAIASLVISFVNIVAGITIGTVMKDMSMAEAASRYTILTIGEGLVAQIPALFVSIAAGILITRVSTDEDGPSANLGQEIVRQISAYPKVLLLSAIAAMLFFMVPGFPKIQFGAAALTFGAIWFFMRRERLGLAGSDTRKVGALGREGRMGEFNLIDEVDPGVSYPVQVRLSRALQGKIDAQEFDVELSAARTRLRLGLGFPFPGLRITYDDEPTFDTYIIDVYDVPVDRGYLPDDFIMVDGSLGTDTEVVIPPFGSFICPVWVRTSLAQQAGVKTWSPTVSLVLKIEHVIRNQAAQLFGFSDMQALLNDCELVFPEVVDQALKVADLQRLTEICKRLLEEGLSVRHLRGILESVANWAPKQKDVILLTEHVRTDLARYLSYRYTRGTGQLHAVIFDPATEAAVREAIQHSSTGSFVALAPEHARQIVVSINDILSQSGMAPMAVVLVSMDIRRYVRKVIEPALPRLPVMSFQEIAVGVNVLPLGRVQIAI